MTDAQKHIVSMLLEGCTVYGSQHGFRLRDENANVIMKINPRTWRQIKRLVRKEKKTGLFVIDKRVVRSLHNGTWVKKKYKVNATKPHHTT
jgi:hypothetical protein